MGPIDKLALQRSMLGKFRGYAHDRMAGEMGPKIPDPKLPEGIVPPTDKSDISPPAGLAEDDQEASPDPDAAQEALETSADPSELSTGKDDLTGEPDGLELVDKKHVSDDDLLLLKQLLEEEQAKKAVGGTSHSVL